jgi:hypothetical protein
MLGHYGPAVVNELEGLRMSLRKVTDEELLRLVEECKAML